MTTTDYMTPNAVAETGFRVLVEKLGAGRAIEFIHQYERGQGDYTKERRQLLKGFKLEDLATRSSKRQSEC